MLEEPVTSLTNAGAEEVWLGGESSIFRLLVRSMTCSRVFTGDSTHALIYHNGLIWSAGAQVCRSPHVLQLA
jgi:hypothetical protein